MSETTEERPAGIPEWAINVRRLERTHLWIWEFSGGSTAYLAWASSYKPGNGNPEYWKGGKYQVFAPLQLPTESLESLLKHFLDNKERYEKAIANEYSNRAAYEEYNSSVRYEEGWS